MKAEMIHNKNQAAAVRRIAVIGNACSGKTVVSRLLSKQLNLPVFHIDQIQYDQNLQIRPRQATIAEITRLQNLNEWIIDGYGPLDILLTRLQAADCVVMLDPPVWRNYFFAIKRIAKLVQHKKRPELPEESSERSFSHIRRLLRNIHQVHTKMRPEMLRILGQPDMRGKTILIKNLNGLKVESDIFSALHRADR